MTIVCWLLAIFTIHTSLPPLLQELETLEWHFLGYQTSTFFYMYFTVYRWHAFCMKFGGRKQRSSSSTDSSGRQNFGLSQIESLKSLLCCPAIHPSQDWRGAEKSLEDFFSFLILHGSNFLILCGSEPEI